MNNISNYEILTILIILSSVTALFSAFVYGLRVGGKGGTKIAVAATFSFLVTFVAGWVFFTSPDVPPNRNISVSIQAK